MPRQDPAPPIPQAAAIPYRVDPVTGQTEVLMIRRHDGGKWGIPKGNVDPGLTQAQAAQMEALQEAGVEGQLSEPPLGSFTYEKQRGTCVVQVYAMKVVHVHEEWDEADVRERRWFAIDEAAAVAGREAVGGLIRRLRSALGVR